MCEDYSRMAFITRKGLKPLFINRVVSTGRDVCKMSGSEADNVSDEGRIFEYQFFPGVNFLFHVKNREVRVKLTGPLAPIATQLIGKDFLEHFRVYKKIKVLAERKGQLVYTLYYPPFPSKAYVRFLRTVSKIVLTRNFTPKAVTIAVTYACQCKCVHCSAGLYEASASKELSTDEMKDVIDQCIDLGATNITFTGGEPLLRNDIYELVGCVDEDEAITQLFTNGLLLSRRNVRRLKDAGLYSLEVSIDSPDPDEHDRLRGVKGCFEMAVKGVERALEEGLLVGISAYATRESLRNGRLEEIIKLGRKLGVHEVSIFDVVPTGKFLDAEDMMLTAEEKKALVRMQFRYNRETGGGFRVSTQAFQTSPLAYIPFGCFAGTNQAYITAYGDVTPCDFTPISFGNIRRESLRSIWKRIRRHPVYRHKSMRCRMQCMDFRERYIHTIPDATHPPCPVELLPAEERESAMAKLKTGFSSLGALLSVDRLRILDSISPRTILKFRVPTKSETMEKLKMDSETFDRNLAILTRSGLVRSEPFGDEVYLFPNYKGLTSLARLSLIRIFLRLISASTPSQPKTAKEWGMDWAEEKEVFW